MKTKMSVAEEIEHSAIVFGNNKDKLKKELMEVRKCLKDDIKKKFGKGKFDFENKRLLSDNGEMCLQWKLRRIPNEKPSYENQQTSTGTVFLIDLKVYDRETKLF